MTYAVNITATSQVKVGFSKLKGIFVSSGTSPTIAVYDSATASTSDPTIISTFTGATAGNYAFAPEGITLSKGLYVVLGGTNPNVTIFYE
jgi:hypothetical protein